MNSRGMLGAIVATSLACGMALFAESGAGPEMRPGGMPNMRMGCGHDSPGCPPMMMEQARKAGADEKQMKALSEYFFEEQMKRIDLQGVVTKSDLTLEHLLNATISDEKAVMQAVDALNQARSDLFRLDVASRLKIKQLLGEDILRKMREQCPFEGNDRGGRGPGNPPPREHDKNAPPEK